MEEIDITELNPTGKNTYDYSNSNTTDEDDDDTSESQIQKRAIAKEFMQTLVAKESEEAIGSALVYKDATGDAQANALKKLIESVSKVRASIILLNDYLNFIKDKEGHRSVKGTIRSLASNSGLTSSTAELLIKDTFIEPEKIREILDEDGVPETFESVGYTFNYKRAMSRQEWEKRLLVKKKEAEKKNAREKSGSEKNLGKKGSSNESVIKKRLNAEGLINSNEPVSNDPTEDFKKKFQIQQSLLGISNKNEKEINEKNKKLKQGDSYTYHSDVQQMMANAQQIYKGYDTSLIIAGYFMSLNMNKEEDIAETRRLEKNWNITIQNAPKTEEQKAGTGLFRGAKGSAKKVFFREPAVIKTGEFLAKSKVFRELMTNEMFLEMSYSHSLNSKDEVALKEKYSVGPYVKSAPNQKWLKNHDVWVQILYNYKHGLTGEILMTVEDPKEQTQIMGNLESWNIISALLVSRDDVEVLLKYNKSFMKYQRAKGGWSLLRMSEALEIIGLNLAMVKKFIEAKAVHLEENYLESVRTEMDGKTWRQIDEEIRKLNKLASKNEDAHRRRMAIIAGCAQVFDLWAFQLTSEFKQGDQSALYKAACEILGFYKAVGTTQTKLVALSLEELKEKTKVIKVDLREKKTKCGFIKKGRGTVKKFDNIEIKTDKPIYAYQKDIEEKQEDIKIRENKDKLNPPKIDIFSAFLKNSLDKINTK